MSETWRDIARPIIARVLKDNEYQDETIKRSELRKAYPWGEKKYHPYKIWLDEIRVQRGMKTFGTDRNKTDSRQLKLF